MWPFNRKKDEKKDTQRSEAETTDSFDPKIDVNTPVTNPSLKQAFKNYRLNGDQPALMTEIRKATFLIAGYKNGIKSTPAGGNNITIEKGSKIIFLQLVDENDRSFLALFTDWDELKLWVKATDDIVGWICPADQAAYLAFEKNNYGGLVINPASDNFVVTRKPSE